MENLTIKELEELLALKKQQQQGEIEKELKEILRKIKKLRETKEKVDNDLVELVKEQAELEKKLYPNVWAESKIPTKPTTTEHKPPTEAYCKFEGYDLPVTYTETEPVPAKLVYDPKRNKFYIPIKTANGVVYIPLDKQFTIPQSAIKKGAVKYHPIYPNESEDIIYLVENISFNTDYKLAVPCSNREDGDGHDLSNNIRKATDLQKDYFSNVMAHMTYGRLYLALLDEE